MGIYRCEVEDVLFLPVRVSFPRAEARLRLSAESEVSSPLLVRLILDSGSRYCSLRPHLMRQLRPPFLRRVEAQTQLGTSATEMFTVDLAFAEDRLAPLSSIRIVALGMPPRLRAYDGVIGRDVLSRWEILYRGPRGRLTIRDHASFWGWLCS
jgi:hypothetical protein